MNSSSKVYWRFIIYFLLFGIIVAFVTSIINYNVKFNNIKNEIANNSNYISKSKKDMIDHYILDIEKDIHAITQNPIFTQYLENPSAKNLTTTQSLFLNTAMSNNSYFQVRFLDVDGLEKIRIDRKRGSDDLIIIENSKLQDKSKRYYFKDSLSIPKNSFWFSKLDLNVEYGKIERPLRPTLRISTQVFHKGKFYGIVIINVEMSTLLNQIKNANNYEVYLIDKDGFFLIHPDETKSWSRYLSKVIIQNDFLQYNMTKLLEGTEQHLDHIHIFSLENQFKNKENIKLILKTKKEYISSLQHNNYTLAVYLALLILLISIPTGLLMALKPARIQDELNYTLKENLKYTNIIDKYVAISSTDIQGYITNVSTAMCDISGYNSNELIGKKMSIFKSGYMDQNIYKDLWNKVTSGLVWSGELQNKTKSGDIFWLKTTVLPQYDDNKILSGYMSVSSDITDKNL